MLWQLLKEVPCVIPFFLPSAYFEKVLKAFDICY